MPEAVTTEQCRKNMDILREDFKIGLKAIQETNILHGQKMTEIHQALMGTLDKPGMISRLIKVEEKSDDIMKIKNKITIFPWLIIASAILILGRDIIFGLFK
jgi:hypothetical protein